MSLDSINALSIRESLSDTVLVIPITDKSMDEAEGFSSVIVADARLS
jgi:hypothetical protein